MPPPRGSFSHAAPRRLSAFIIDNIRGEISSYIVKVVCRVACYRTAVFISRGQSRGNTRDIIAINFDTAGSVSSYALARASFIRTMRAYAAFVLIISSGR